MVIPNSEPCAEDVQACGNIRQNMTNVSLHKPFVDKLVNDDGDDDGNDMVMMMVVVMMVMMMVVVMMVVVMVIADDGDDDGGCGIDDDSCSDGWIMVMMMVMIMDPLYREQAFKQKLLNYFQHRASNSATIDLS
ncbi:Hypothetical predicted protein [Paramuricea clavata]|uniref:Uncharacterized protein n=1 Tax=Paramuricea clavata TaxID=317549 RepID=A0A7D9LPS4_PARCT|nr:Hypothetical predicted protein [Paramuricea clavata]